VSEALAEPELLVGKNPFRLVLPLGVREKGGGIKRGCSHVRHFTQAMLQRAREAAQAFPEMAVRAPKVAERSAQSESELMLTQRVRPIDCRSEIGMLELKRSSQSG
jgi:hypothetical protein